VRSYCFFWKGVASERLSSTSFRMLACSSSEAKSYDVSVRMSEDLKVFQGFAYLVGEEALCA
jgi:hypothetical protein